MGRNPVLWTHHEVHEGEARDPHEAAAADAGQESLADSSADRLLGDAKGLRGLLGREQGRQGLEEVEGPIGERLRARAVLPLRSLGHAIPPLPERVSTAPVGVWIARETGRGGFRDALSSRTGRTFFSRIPGARKSLIHRDWRRPTLRVPATVSPDGGKWAYRGVA